MTGHEGGGARTGAGVNAGYQRDDRDIVDYGMWPVADQQARGPQLDPNAPFGVAIGAAQVFGRFVQQPFPAQLGAALGIPMLNLGFSGAGPSFFLQRPELLDLANAAKFAVVHLMSGRSLSNSRLIVDRNQGTALFRDQPERRAIFAEDAYKQLMQSLPVAELARLRAEIRHNYVVEMRALLDRITVPKVLLYWARRPLDYAENLRGIAGYWGDFPHFVNREIVDQLRGAADTYVEVVSDRGLPQPLYSSTTGQPIEIWPAERFPNVQLRNHNYYYPSPEMNDDAAQALLPACRRLLERTAGEAPHMPVPRRRQLLVNIDIFGNAGEALGRSLRESFGPYFLDGGTLGASATAVVERVRSEPKAQAIASPWWRFDLNAELNADVHTIVLLQQPLLRAKALYELERSEARQRGSTAIHTRLAGSGTLAEWIEWCLTDPVRAAPITNYQTRICGRTANGLTDEDWSHKVTLAGYEEALANLTGAHVGTVEDLEGSMVRLEAALRPDFPMLRLMAYNTSLHQASMETIDRALADLCEELGEQLFEHLAAANAYDLLLHQQARSPSGACPG